MKKKIPDALRLKLSKAGKKGWRAKIKKYQVGQANAKIGKIKINQNGHTKNNN